jgi:hypothetical protein
MSDENVAQAKLLHYNDAGTDFLDRVHESEATAPASKMYRNSDWFVVCKELGFSEDEIDAIVIDEVDFNTVEITTVIDLLCFQREGDRYNFESTLRNLTVVVDSDPSNATSPTTPLTRRIEDNCVNFNIIDHLRINNDDDDDETQSLKLVTAMTCKLCDQTFIDTVTLPCGHLLYCSSCTDRHRNRIDPICPVCGQTLRGFCKLFLA